MPKAAKGLSNLLVKVDSAVVISYEKMRREAHGGLMSGICQNFDITLELGVLFAGFLGQLTV